MKLSVILPIAEKALGILNRIITKIARGKLKRKHRRVDRALKKKDSDKLSDTILGRNRADK